MMTVHEVAEHYGVGDAFMGFRTPPHDREYRSYFCEAYLRLRIDGRIDRIGWCRAPVGGDPADSARHGRLVGAAVRDWPSGVRPHAVHRRRALLPAGKAPVLRADG